MLRAITKRTIKEIKNQLEDFKIRRQFKKDFVSLRREIENNEFLCSISEPKAVAVLLSYKRPKNMPWIVKSLLKNDFVSRVIVSNNNPEIKLENWFSFTDSRLEIINQKVRRRAGYRFEIARHIDSDYFIFIDDDLFLKPSQIANLYNELLSNPSVPHGVWGQRFYKDKSQLSWKDGVRYFNGELDVINRSYFLTREHVEKFGSLLKMIGIQQITDLKFGDDMILSFSGKSRPKCHDVGNLLNCPSKDAKEIAIWQEGNFFTYRRQLYEKLSSIRNSAFEHN